MAQTTVGQEAGHRYGFNIYKGGKLIREQVVVAGTAAIAEVKVYRYLADGEYPWYVVPRLIEMEAVAVDIAADTHESIDSDREQAA